MRIIRNVSAGILAILGLLWLHENKNRITISVAPEIPEVWNESEIEANALIGPKMDVETPKFLITPVSDARDLYYPEGEYVTKERISQTTATGVIGIPAGEKVIKVGEKDGRFLISNGKVTVESPLGKLTNERALGEVLISKRKEAPQIVENAPERPEIVSTAPVIPQPLATRNTAAIDAQIVALEDKIEKLETKATSQINANGPVITRLRIELEKLKKQREAP